MATGAAALVIAGLGLLTRPEWTRPSVTADVELVQSGAVVADAPAAEQARQALLYYADVLSHSSAELVVTPQFAVAKTPESLPPGYLAGLEAKLRARNADALIGMYFESDRTDQYYNGVQSLGASGHQRYSKQHLFPFGEYMPLPVGMKTWVNSKLEHPRADTARGAKVEDPLFGGGLRLALAVCYEIAFGEMLRPQAAAADAIVNIGSDGTHDSLLVVHQTTQIAQARALEFQKPVVRTSDVRGTFFIDHDGQLTAELPARSAATLMRAVHGRSGLTPYARWGDTLALGVVVISMALCGFLGARAAKAGQRRVPDDFSIAGSAPVVNAAPRAALLLTRAGPARQHGQVLPASLALLVIVSGFFYFMVNSGQAITEKVRVTNAADAAAYSAAVVEARALNYDSYLNRAMVANQMAIAQMVSFSSWLEYFASASDHFAENITDINKYVLPNLDVIVLDAEFGGSSLAAAYFGGNSVKHYVDNVVNYGAGAIITAHDLATMALEASQIAVQANLLAGLRQGQIADKVVKAMDPKLDSEVVLVSHGFDTFTKNYSGDDRNRFADVATRSRSPFTKERNFTISSFDIPFFRRDGALKKRGGTDLIGLDEWRAVDTLELHGEEFSFDCGRFLPAWCDDIKKPIGWGGVEVSKLGDSGHGYHGNAYGDNPTTAKKADADMKSPTLAFFHGLPRSQEIADTDAAKEQVTGITILVSKLQADTLTSGGAAAAKPSGDLAVFDAKPAGGRVAALGRAEVYFDRIAARADGKTELGSLYNPYWRVRLVAPTQADRIYAATKQGGLFIPDVP